MWHIHKRNCACRWQGSPCGLSASKLEARRWDGYRGHGCPAQLLGSWSWPGATLQAPYETRMRGAIDAMLNRIPFWYSVSPAQSRYTAAKEGPPLAVARLRGCPAGVIEPLRQSGVLLTAIICMQEESVLQAVQKVYHAMAKAVSPTEMARVCCCWRKASGPGRAPAGSLGAALAGQLGSAPSPATASIGSMPCFSQPPCRYATVLLLLEPPQHNRNAWTACRWQGLQTTRRFVFVQAQLRTDRDSLTRRCPLRPGSSPHVLTRPPPHLGNVTAPNARQNASTVPRDVDTLDIWTLVMPGSAAARPQCSFAAGLLPHGAWRALQLYFPQHDDQVHRLCRPWTLALPPGNLLHLESSHVGVFMPWSSRFTLEHAPSAKAAALKLGPRCVSVTGGGAGLWLLWRHISTCRLQPIVVPVAGGVAAFWRARNIRNNANAGPAALDIPEKAKTLSRSGC